jgi:hypothetical protein
VCLVRSPRDGSSGSNEVLGSDQGKVRCCVYLYLELGICGNGRFFRFFLGGEIAFSGFAFQSRCDLQKLADFAESAEESNEIYV